MNAARPRRHRYTGLQPGHRGYAFRGYAFVELLVAVTISMFLLLGLTSYFTQSRQTQNLQQAFASLQEHERVISVLLNRSVRHAGYSEIFRRSREGRDMLFPSDAPFAASQIVLGVQQDTAVDVIGEALPVTFPDDTLSIRYLGDGATMRCNGTVSTLNTVHTELISTNGEHLMCNFGGGSVDLVGLLGVPEFQQVRILGMQVNYGEDGNNDNIVESYNRAGSVTDWDSVKVAEIDVFIQTGAQPPQAVNIVIPFENVVGVNVL